MVASNTKELERLVPHFDSALCVIRRVRFPIIEVGAQCKIRKNSKPHEWYLLKLLVLEGAMLPEQLTKASGIPKPAILNFLKDTLARGIVSKRGEFYEVTEEGMLKLKENNEGQETLVEWSFLFDATTGFPAQKEVYEQTKTAWERSTFGIPMAPEKPPSLQALLKINSSGIEVRDRYRFSPRILEVMALAEHQRVFAVDLLLAGDASGEWKLFFSGTEKEFLRDGASPNALKDLQILKPNSQQLQALKIELSEFGIFDAKLHTRRGSCPALETQKNPPKSVIDLQGKRIWLPLSGLVVEVLPSRNTAARST